MKALVIGQGGREHALVKALAQSPSVTEVHALPGSDGIAQDAECHAIKWEDAQAVAQLVSREKIDFVVIGPEVPLVDGLSDRLRALDVPVVGPSQEAARLEGSKIFCKEFLLSAGVPTAHSKVVSSVEETRSAMGGFTPPYVLKADGLAAGKGVFICKTEAELLAAAHSIFNDKSLGSAGESALLEQFQPGYEISYLVLTNGSSYEPLPLAQDHKRLLDGDEGPNTGGMGVVAPVEMDADLRARIDREVMAPTMAEMKKRGFIFRGCLFVGLMITPKGPSVLEFNTRFGDPETQAILPLLDGDWGTVFRSLAQSGDLLKLKWKQLASCCVVLAAKGYPDSPVKDVAIEGLPSVAGATGEQSYFLHAGTKLTNGKWTTAGGRVLGAVGIGANLRAAVDSAYRLANGLKSEGLQMRRDIGAKVLTKPSER